MPDVLKNLIDGLSEAWVKVGKYWRIPCKSAITQGRQRRLCRGNDAIVSSVGATNGKQRNNWKFSKRTENCSD